MKDITDFLEQFRVSSKPLIWKLDRKGREDLEMFVSEQKRQARMDFARRLKEIGLLDFARLLDPREVKILDMRLLEGKTYEEVGKEFGVTRERIRAIETKAIEQVKNTLVWKPEEDGVV